MNRTMYLLSIEGVAAQTILRTKQTPSCWQTVYRWGMYWGYWIPSEGKWSAERHQYVTHSRDTLGNTFLLERIEPSTQSAPPMIIDDVWKEEIKHDGVCTYGNVLTIRGNTSTIQDMLKELSISYSLPPESSTEETKHSSSSETPHRPLPRPEPHPQRTERRHRSAGGEHPDPEHTGRPAHGRQPGRQTSSPLASSQRNRPPPRNGERGVRGTNR